MELVLISGRSGSGKSTALHQLEDDGFYAIDNLPVPLLARLVQEISADAFGEYEGVAVCIDARNLSRDFSDLDRILERMPSQVRVTSLYLDADQATLIKRFSETRRRHPLSNDEVPLSEALEQERRHLEALANSATLTLDTSQMTIYELRDTIRQRVVGSEQGDMSVLIQSFGFKRGVPSDADLVFDVRMLPNPHWSKDLRMKTGLDPDVCAFIEESEAADQLFADITGFLDRWLPEYRRSSRSYMTIAIGCTGGQHRSVYFAHRLFQHYRGQDMHFQLRHRELQ